MICRTLSRLCYCAGAGLVLYGLIAPVQALQANPFEMFDGLACIIAGAMLAALSKAS